MTNLDELIASDWNTGQVLQWSFLGRENADQMRITPRTVRLYQRKKWVQGGLMVEKIQTAMKWSEFVNSIAKKCGMIVAFEQI